jgi:hypothetical protein
VKPKLVVMITVDQLRPDYLVKWKSQLTGGFATLQTDGAVFANAYQDHGVTETAPGHSTVLSGRWPAHTGIITNTLGVIDSTAPLIGVNGPGASPRRFRGTAFYDWLRAADSSSIALSVSTKDRGAILPIGTAKQDVYWFFSGVFTTSRYYRDSLPLWVRTFNSQRVPFRASGKMWKLLLPDSAYPEPDSVPWENGGVGVTFPHTLPTDSARAAVAIVATPFMDSLTLALALYGADAMLLGRRGHTDLLAVSLSATDYIGHAFGPDSREIHDQVLRLDRTLDWFLKRLFDRYGRGNVMIVLTADHGVSSYPERAVQQGQAGARGVNIDTLVTALNAGLEAALNPGAPVGTPPRAWFRFDPGILFLLDNGRIAAAGLNADSVVRAAQTRIRAATGIARVDTPADLARADTVQDPIARRWLHHIAPDAGIALVVTLQDWDVWILPPPAVNIAEHGQPSDRDAHVPLIMWGKGIKPGSYAPRANTVDIAPTLARLLGLTPLSLLDGRVLQEALVR